MKRPVARVRTRHASCTLPRLLFCCLPFLLLGLACIQIIIRGQTNEGAPILTKTRQTGSRAANSPAAWGAREDAAAKPRQKPATRKPRASSPPPKAPEAEAERSSPEPPRVSPSGKPNILLIIADDLRPQLGIYGRRALTPHLDRLASEGTTFEHAYAQITVCNPSRASFLSGRRPDTTEIFGFEAGTPPGWTTLPALFRRNGYNVFGVGKVFHWGPGPEDAWTSEVPRCAEPSALGLRLQGSNSTDERLQGLPWEMPSGGFDRTNYESAARLRCPPRDRHQGAGGMSLAGFWPNSDVFQAIKGAEQKALKSTVQPEPGPMKPGGPERGLRAPSGNAKAVPTSSEAKRKGGADGAGRAALPFRDGVFGSRAIRLLEVAHANRPAPWFLALGLSLPHEPLRFPKWAWDQYKAPPPSPQGGGPEEEEEEEEEEGGGGFALPVWAAPHPRRPLGSPIFAYGDIKERFAYYDHGTAPGKRRLSVQNHYGPRRPRSFPADPRASSRSAQPQTAKEALVQGEGEAARRARREAYLERLTLRAREGGPAAQVTDGADYFGAMDREVWLDRGNEIGEVGLPLDARIELARGYSAAVTFMDYQVGRVLSFLEHGLPSAHAQTLVVVTSDHGYALGDHGGFGKRTLFDHDARVPLVVKLPPAWPGGGGGVGVGCRRERFRMVELVDLFPTLVELAGLHRVDPLARKSQGAFPDLPPLKRGGESPSHLAGEEAGDRPRGEPRGEPPLDGKSFAGLLLGGGASAASSGKEAGRDFAISQFPRCPVRLNRRGERKFQLSEPWRSSGAAGFECQGRASDWTGNHDLAIMGYSIKTLDWRYTAWLRVVGYKTATPPPPKGKKPAAASPAAASAWPHNRLVVNWTYPPYVHELYPHADPTRKGEAGANNAPGGTGGEEGGAEGVAAGAVARLLAEGGGFDLKESENEAPLHPGVSKELFGLLKSALEPLGQT